MANEFGVVTRKLNPWLIRALNETRGMAAGRHALGTRGGGLTIRELEALLVVRCDPDAAIGESVEALGGHIDQDAGPIRTLRLPLHAAPELASIPDIHRVRLSRRLSPALERVLTVHDIAAYRERNTGTRLGKDVVIGIVDSGVDGSHSAFAGRILECWDQTTRGKGNARFRYGTFLLGKSGVDFDGHGTHVAGIAGAIAPKARLIVVRTTWEDAHIQDAITYIFARAAELGLPAVVNLSLGGHADAHDGTDDLDAHIGFQSGPGRIVVAAAGNEGTDNIHTSVDLKSGEQVHLGFRIPDRVEQAVLNVWYTGAGEVALAVATPFGSSTAYQGTIPDDPEQVYALASSGRVAISTPGVHPVNGDKPVLVTIDAPPGAHYIQPGRWFLHLRCSNGPVVLHAWSVVDAVTWANPVNSHLIGSPGSARDAITVGAYVSRPDWVSEDGSSWTLGFSDGSPAPFSSPGPLRSASASASPQKPDVSAAGAMVLSARSSGGNYDRDQIIDAEQAAMMGTSMACPVVAGLAASLLEANPNWDVAKVRAALQAASPHPYNEIDGFGLVEASKLP